MLSITVYTKPKCQPCRATIRFLDDRGIEHEVKDTTDPAYLAEAKALGYMGAPVVVVVPTPGESVSHWYGFRPDMLGELAETLGKTEKVAA